MIDNDKNLFYLKELPDYRVAPDCYDVRGWRVVNDHGSTIGKVGSLLVNKQSKKVVYLEVEVDKLLIANYTGLFESASCINLNENLKEDAFYIVIPIRMVDLNKDEKLIITNEVRYTNILNKRISY